MHISLKTDPSILFFERLCSQVNPEVHILLKNDQWIQGYLIGFYKGDPDFHEPYIRMWHVVADEDRWALGVNRYGALKGELIRTEDIQGIRLHLNNEWIPFHE